MTTSTLDFERRSMNKTMEIWPNMADQFWNRDIELILKVEISHEK